MQIAIKPPKSRSGIAKNFCCAFMTGSAVLSYERDDQGNGAFLLGTMDENLNLCLPDGEKENHED